MNGGTVTFGGHLRRAWSQHLLKSEQSSAFTGGVAMARMARANDRRRWSFMVVALLVLQQGADGEMVGFMEVCNGFRFQSFEVVTCCTFP